MKIQLFNKIDEIKNSLINIADYIFDNPEIDGNEFKAAKILTDTLRQNDFKIELGIADLPTAFKAIFTQGNGGPTIGLLCEYDALENLGHGCAHHMQGPACIGAALAIKEILKNENYSLVIYGTPAEETFGGKIKMLKAGYFYELDVALMMHGAPNTCTDIKSLALSTFDVIFYGKKSHAAIMPENGRSALDALLLSFQGIEFLREHVRDDVKMHYTIKEVPGPENIIPDKAIGRFSLRSYSRKYLDSVITCFKNIITGAALMSDVTFEIIEKDSYDNKIPVLSLNNLLIENAKLLKVPGITQPREKTGSTDFGNVMNKIPGSCIRVKFVSNGTSSHSKEYIEAGKTDEAHNCILNAAKILAATSYDLITDNLLLNKIKEEFQQNEISYQ